MSIKNTKTAPLPAQGLQVENSNLLKPSAIDLSLFNTSYEHAKVLDSQKLVLWRYILILFGLMQQRWC